MKNLGGVSDLLKKDIFHNTLKLSIRSFTAFPTDQKKKNSNKPLTKYDWLSTTKNIDIHHNNNARSCVLSFNNMNFFNFLIWKLYKRNI